MAGNRGAGRIYLPKNSRRWMLAYYGPKPDGSWGEIRESSHSEKEEDAQTLLGKRRRQAQNHRDGIRTFEGAKAQRATMNELLDALIADYRAREIKSLSSVLVHVKPLRALLGRDLALRITPDRIRKYQQRRRSEGRKNSTINREVELVSSAFRLAVNEGRLSVAPRIPSLPDGEPRTGFFERAEVDALLSDLPAPLDDVVRFAYVTGWRRGEILSLRWENIDREAKEIRLTTSKNGEGRLIPMDDALLEILERCWKARGFTRGSASTLSPVVFHRQGKEIFPTTLGRQWRAACVKAGLGRYAKDPNGRLCYEGKIFHDLRRTAARNLIRSGVSQHVAMRITGHKTAAMFTRYNITSTDDVLDALRRREAYASAQSRPPVVRPFRTQD